MVFDRYTVVRVPFPFTDRTATKNRPALVLSHRRTFNTPAGHSVLRLSTLDHRLVRGAIGKLSAADAARVSAGLSQLLGVAPDRAQP